MFSGWWTCLLTATSKSANSWQCLSRPETSTNRSDYISLKKLDHFIIENVNVVFSETAKFFVIKLILFDCSGWHSSLSRRRSRIGLQDPRQTGQSDLLESKLFKLINKWIWNSIYHTIISIINLHSVIKI